MLFRTGIVSKNQSSTEKTTRDLHMLHANKLQRPQLYFFSFFRVKPASFSDFEAFFHMWRMQSTNLNEFCLRYLIFLA